MIYVSHDLGAILRLTSEVAVLRAGRVGRCGAGWARCSTAPPSVEVLTAWQQAGFLRVGRR